MNILRNSILIPICFLMIFSTMLHAQKRMGADADRHQEIEAQRIAFITQHMALTPQEAAVFWPVYNEFTQKRFALMQEHRTQWREIRTSNDLSEAEKEKLADLDIDNMREMLTLRETYHKRFKTILPAHKVFLLYQAEKDFNRELFREHRRGGGRGRGN